ncbi:cupredoxin domain-containing protein [Actinopolymorpha pittospori]
MRARILVGGLAIALVAAAGCSPGEPPPRRTAKSPEASSTPAAVRIGAKTKVAGLTANYHGTKNVSGARTARVELEDFYFTPTVLRGRPGQRMTLIVENESQTPHTFTTSDKQLDVQLQPGGIARLAIRFPRSGNMSFFSTGHERQGMAGGLTVSGPIAKKAPTPRATSR